MTVTFELTIEDCVAFSLYHFRHSPAAQRTKRLNYLSAVLIAGFVLYISREHPFIVRIATTAGAVLGGFAFVGWYLRWGAKRAIRRFMSEGHNKGVVGQHVIEIAPNGLSERTAFNESRWVWASVERIEEDDQYIFIYTQAISAHTIPKRAFAGRDEAQTFLAAARSYHRVAAGESLTAPV